MAKSASSITLNGGAAEKFLAALLIIGDTLGLGGLREAAEKVSGQTWPLVVTLARKRPKRNHEQNNLYWAWLKILGDEIGYDPEDIHYLLRAKILGLDDLGIPVSTTTCSITVFSEYLEGVKAFAAERGIVLPDTIEEWKAWQTA